ncbi:MAG: DsbA family protein [Aggregatilineales bacterium]
MPALPFVALAFLLLLAGGAGGAGIAVIALRDQQAPAPQPAANLDAPAVQNAPEVLPDADPAATLDGAADYARRGPQNAPVQIVVFSDPRCPYCQRLAQEAEPQIIQEYGEKVAITYRHFAILGPQSQAAAHGLDCAGQVGGAEGFWAYHAALYAEGGSEAKPEALAAQAKLDAERFAACIANPGGQVDADRRAADNLRVTGTPTTFVNGKRLAGALPFDYFKAAIDEMLKGDG